MMVTNDRKHDHHAVYHFVGVANEHLKKSGVESDYQVHFLDGASTQYKRKINFADMTFSKKDYRWLPGTKERFAESDQSPTGTRFFYIYIENLINFVC